MSVYAHSKASPAETVSVASKVCLFWSDKLKVSNLIYSLPYYQYGNDYMCQFYSQSRSPFCVSFNPITRLPLCVSFSSLARPPLHVSFNPITRPYIFTLKRLSDFRSVTKIWFKWDWALSVCQFYSLSKAPLGISFNPITWLPLGVSLSPLARPSLCRF